MRCMNGGANPSAGSTGMHASTGGSSGGSASTRSGPAGVDRSANVASTCTVRLPPASSEPDTVANVRPRFTTSVVTVAGPGCPGARKWPVAVNTSGRSLASRIARNAMRDQVAAVRVAADVPSGPDLGRVPPVAVRVHRGIAREAHRGRTLPNRRQMSTVGVLE